MKVWKLFSVRLQLRLKGDFSKHTIHVLNLPTELQNTEVSFISLKIDSTTDALPEILRILGTNKGNIYDGLTFWYSCRWVDWRAWNATKDILLTIFQNVHSNSNIYLKNLWSNFCRSVCIKSDLHYIRFFYDFQKFSAQLFQNALIKWSVMELSRVPGCRLWSCIILKSVSTGDNFLKFLEVKLSPPKVGSEIIPT